MPGFRIMETPTATLPPAEHIPFETWSDIAACLIEDKSALYNMSLLSRKIYLATQSHLHSSVDIGKILHKRKSQAVVQLAAAIPHSSIWADSLKSITFPWLTPHLAPQAAIDALLKICAACPKISKVELVMEHPPKHDWTSATAILRGTLDTMPNLAKISYTRSKECPFLTFIRTMDALSSDRDFLIDGRRGDRLGKVNLGLLRSQEDVHQSLIELEPRTYLFWADQLIVRIPPFPAVATTQVVAALFTCETLSLSMACLPDKANIVFSHLADKVVHLHLDLAIVSSTTQERLNMRHFKALETLKMSPKMDWPVMEQLLDPLPNSLETLDFPYFSAEIADFLENLFWRIKTGIQASSLHTIYIPAQALQSLKSRGVPGGRSKLSTSACEPSYVDTILAVQKKAGTLEDHCTELGIAVRPYSFRDALAA